MASRTMKKGGRAKHAKGGKAEHLYNAQGSPEAREEEDEKDEFKKGGKALKKGGKAEGKEAKERGDRKPRHHKRAAGGHTPFSSGHNVSEPKGVASGHESERP